MARPERFELPTPRFVVWCSIQLSYGRVLRGAQGDAPATDIGRERAPSYRLRSLLARLGTIAHPPRSAGNAIAAANRISRTRAPRGELDRAVRDGEPEGRPDGAFHQADLAAVGAYQLGCDGKAETGAAGAG
jgi:hypothetical protein